MAVAEQLVQMLQMQQQLLSAIGAVATSIFRAPEWHLSESYVQLL